MIILIPAYQPDIKLIKLIEDIREKCDYSILIIDDGSGSAYDNIFNEATIHGCTVIRYERNMGKGHALKTGYKHLLDSNINEGIICADSDGQHKIEDILKVAEHILEDNSIILGTRNFVNKVPFKSLLGNILTRIMFYLATRLWVKDTQTGLRGYSYSMLKWLISIEGSRYEYELNVLLEAKKTKHSLYQVDIDTIYIDNNKASHFRPVVDSLRIYWPLIKFSISSIASAVLDFIILLVADHFTNDLLFSVVTARIISSVFNFVTNKNFVFKAKENQNTITAAAKYFLLVLIIMSANYGLMYLFKNNVGLPTALAKLITEGLLFIVSYKVQRVFIFNNQEQKTAHL